MLSSLLSLIFLGIAGYLATIDLGLEGQLWLGGGIVGLLILLKPLHRNATIRLAAIAFAAFASFRYFYWRATETLPTENWVILILGLLLMAAEGYGIWIYTSGAFIGLRPIDRRSAPLPSDPARLPTVDILVPSYDEPWDIVGTTLIAARNIRWPEGKLRVVLCDDGGTKQRREASDMDKADAALRRHEEFKTKCAEIGVTYITRDKNVGAKAGNLNHAMKTLPNPAQLVAIFDADHVPTADFLERTVGFFLEDEKLSLVQTPHNFITPDPLEKNLGTFGVMPGEADMFYGAVQPGLDFWNASFFCGSAAVIRRKALDEIGGIQEDTVTEDAHTSLEMHARGWNSAYLPRPMVAGLHPASYASFVKQRVRWTQGMIQIFLRHNPLLKRGLGFAQRLCYGANSGFWFFPFARICFLLSPIPYLVFGLEIFRATTTDFLAYAMPHLAASIIMTDILHGRWRWPFVSELYELALSLYTLPAVAGTIMSPKKPTFAVTAKDEQLDRDFLSPLAKPFLGMLGLLTLALLVGIWRAAVNPADLDAIFIVLLWDAFNILLLLGAIGAMYELRHRRTSPRVDRDLPAAVTIGDKQLPVRIIDASIGGVAIRGDGFTVALQPMDSVALSFQSPGGQWIEANCQIRHRRDDGAYGLMFVEPTLATREAIIRIVYGSSDTWAADMEKRTKRHGMLKGFAFFLKISLGHGLSALGRTFFSSGA